MSEATNLKLLQARHEAHVRAWNELDLDALRDLYDPECLIFDSLPPPRISGWKSFRKLAQRVASEFSELRIKTSEHSFRVDERLDDRIGYVTSRYKLKAKRDGAKYKASGRWTEIYEKRHDTWKLIHFHSSVDPEGD